MADMSHHTVVALASYYNFVKTGHVYMRMPMTNNAELNSTISIIIDVHRVTWTLKLIGGGLTMRYPNRGL